MTTMTISFNHEFTTLNRATRNLVIDTLIATGHVNDRDRDGRTPLMRTFYSVEVSRALLSHGADATAVDNDGKTALHHACDATVGLLVAAGTDVNARSSDGDTPLHCATDATVVDVLVAAGADVNARSSDGRTPVMNHHLKVDVCRSLLGHGADATATDENGNTAFHFTLVENKIVVDMLVAAGANVNARSSDGCTPLMNACIHVEVCRALLSHGADATAVDKNGKTALHFATNMAVVDALVAAGVDVNARSSDGRTLLMNHYFPFEEVCRALLNHGADVTAVDNDGCTVLHHATDEAFVDVLVAAGADVNARSNVGRTPLMEVNFKVEVSRALLSHGADATAADNDGKTALHFAEKVTVVDMLVAAGADVNARSNVGRTPLMEVDFKVEVSRALLSHGADATAADNDGKTALHFAEEVTVVDVLVAAGADVNARSSVGRTPLMNFCPCVGVEVCRALLSHGADATAVDDHGCTALHFARDKTIIDMFVSAGANINAKSVRDRTPLMYAATCPKAVRALVRLGADVTLADCDGYTAIFRAKDKEVVDMLAAAGADVDAKAEYGITPLMNACRDQLNNESSIEAARALLDNGASVNMQDDDRRTCLCVIFTDKCDCVFAMADLLLRSGADEKIADSRGLLPVDWLRVRRGEIRIYEREERVQLRKMLLSAPQGRAWRRRGLLLMCMARNAGAESSLASWLEDSREGHEGIFRTVVGYI